MAQVRRLPHNRSPPPRQIPSLPNPIRIQPPTQNNNRLITREVVHHSPQNGIPPNKQYDPVTGLMIPNNQNHEQSSYIDNSSFNHQQQPIFKNNTETEESVILPTLNNDDDLSLSLDKKHLPVYAQFPFNVSFLPQPMDTNVEDNVHKLRLRLIDSELNHQRRSTDEYIKRTQREVSLSSPVPTEYDIHNGRPPTELVHRQIVPKLFSRQTSLSRLTGGTPISMRDRIGMENDLQDTLDIERELEIRRIQKSLNSGRRSKQKLMISNYSYDPRIHLHPVDEERQYLSSNMDDLIDSMARRHLANRRLDAAIERQRRSNGYHGSYIEALGTGRSVLQNDDLLYRKRTPGSQIEHDSSRANPNNFNHLLRSRIDYYNRIQPDTDSMGIDDTVRTTSYRKLPPISPGYNSNRYNHLKNPSTSTLYEHKHDSHIHHQSLSNRSEHLIDLPSDIFITSGRDAHKSSQRHQRTRKTRPRSISKEARSETDRSDGENNSSIVNRQHSHHKKSSQKSHHGSVTGSNVQQKKKTKHHRNLFKKVAIGILFIITLKRRAMKNREHRAHQSPSATIHKIRLQEIIVALHRVYLEPDGPVYNALTQAITNTISLQDGMNKSSKNYSEAIEIIGYALKNVISKIIEFMPKDGVLGTTKTSAVSALIQDGNPFPENYFWQCERELFEFDNLKIINITKDRAIVLLLGIFIFRALVTTLLIKPIKYRLILGQLTSKQSASLKVLASVMLYVGRQATIGSNSDILTLPHEWQLSLYTDRDIEAIIQHSEIKSIIESCQQSLRMWCEEYIRRIDENFGRELRT